MANLRDLRRRITGVKNTAKITSAMKMVSAAKLRRAQNAIESARPYVLKLQDILSNVVAGVGESYSHPLLTKSDKMDNILILVVGSDRGLCGSFNAQLFKSVNNFVDNDLKAKNPDVNVNIVPIGNRVVSNYNNKKTYNIFKKFNDVFKELKFDTTLDIINSFENDFIEGKVDRVYVFYNEFINVVRQEAKYEQLLPIEQKQVEEEASGVETAGIVDYIFEPNQTDIMDVLLPKLLNISLWRTILESNAAEQAARMMAMDNATNNANELIEELNLTYNKERQAAITTEMLEIVGGAEALENE